MFVAVGAEGMTVAKPIAGDLFSGNDGDDDGRRHCPQPSMRTTFARAAFGIAAGRSCTVPINHYPP
jgi:hypothetical protein